MERGDMLREVHTTQPEQPAHSFIKQAAFETAEQLGMDMDRMFYVGWLKTTSEEVGSAHGDSGCTNNWLHTLWYRDDRVAVAFETRDERNNVVTECVYLGVRDLSAQVVKLIHSGVDDPDYRT